MEKVKLIDTEEVKKSTKGIKNGIQGTTEGLRGIIKVYEKFTKLFNSVNDGIPTIKSVNDY